MIRSLYIEQIEAIASLHATACNNSWSHEMLYNMLENPSYIAYGFYQNDVMIAFVIGIIIIDEAEIHMICTHPDHQRKGIAEDLMTHMTKELQNRCVTLIHLEVSHQNKGAISLYKKLGFIQTGMRKTYYPDGSNALIMQKEINI